MFSNTHKMVARSLMTLALGVAFAAGSTVASAKESRHRENLVNTVEAIDNRIDLADDRFDLTRLEKLVRQWRTAYQVGDKAAMRSADQGIKSWIKGELRESRSDVTEARYEVKDSRHEARSDGRTVVGNHNSHPRKASKAAVRGTADDRRDLRDDKGDLSTARMDYSRTREIASQLDRIQSKFDRRVATRADYQKKNRLLGELLSMAQSEVVADRGEIREDRSERREDRRGR